MLILFVCTGNTCRSPMAMGLFQEMAKKEGLHNVVTDSAGIIAVDGLPPSENAIEALKEEDIDISGYTSKKITEELIKSADLIVGISTHHIISIVSLIPETASKTVLLGFGIDDPYGLTLDDYKETREEIKNALTDLLEVVKNYGEAKNS